MCARVRPAPGLCMHVHRGKACTRVMLAHTPGPTLHQGRACTCTSPPLHYGCPCTCTRVWLAPGLLLHLRTALPAARGGPIPVPPATPSYPRHLADGHDVAGAGAGLGTRRQRQRQPEVPDGARPVFPHQHVLAAQVPVHHAGLVQAWEVGLGGGCVTGWGGGHPRRGRANSAHEWPHSPSRQSSWCRKARPRARERARRTLPAHVPTCCSRKCRREPWGHAWRHAWGHGAAPPPPLHVHAPTCPPLLAGAPRHPVRARARHNPRGHPGHTRVRRQRPTHTHVHPHVQPSRTHQHPVPTPRCHSRRGTAGGRGAPPGRGVRHPASPAAGPRCRAPSGATRARPAPPRSVRPPPPRRP